ncbi:MAG: tRNA uracil 4-sulfurtransferase ThiI [Mariprofundaceae bacterium]|nr:tRNA uracil 4-sulfurtransferase ThiI [Mariprofundaceae bacterium]
MQYILIHYAELSLKGKNRRDFEKQLAKNIKYLLRPTQIIRQHGRMLLHFEHIDNSLLDYLALIPGISNFAVVHSCPTDIEGIQRTAESAINTAFPEPRGKRFCVRSRRSDKKYPLISTEINFEVGGYLKEHFDFIVNINDPEITVFVEVTKDEAFVYTDKRKGVGGLPVGSSGHGVVLFSGGIDSPVAAYTMMKRGMRVTLVHLYNSTINRDFTKMENLAKQLSRYQGRLKLIMIDLEEFQRHAIALVPARYRMIVYKRHMIRTATLVAEQTKALALITGDALGQVASQTLENIHAIYDATPLPLLSPLIGYDKEEIISMARKVGTYEISIEEYCDICSYLIAKHPETKGKRDKIAEFEAELPLEGLELIQQERLFVGGKEKIINHDR